jgi:hypothetical protein
MKTVVLVHLMVAAVLGGCSGGSYKEPSAFTRAADCARNGGRWIPGEGAYAYCQLPQ